MKRILALIAALLLFAVLLTACTKENPPDPYVVHDGKLWKIPDETVEMELPEDAEFIEATRVPMEILPTRENECNFTHGTILIYDGDGFFLVIINDVQYRIDR